MSNIRCTLDKLKGIKADLVRGNEGWKDWGFKDFLTELQKWTQINPVEEIAAEKPEKDPIHINQSRVPEISASTARMTNTEQLIAQKSQVFMIDRKSYPRKNCALIARVQLG